jgi:2-haloacid dehalogenase
VNARSWVLFDLNGTLLDPEPVATALPVDDGTEIVLAALHDAVVQGMTDTLSGEYRPFLSYIRGALSRQVRLAGTELDAEALQGVVRMMAAMPPQPDAADAVAVLRDAGCRVGVLTNSASGAARDALEMSGLGSAVQCVIGSDDVRAYKPATVVYRTAVDQLDVPPAAVTMVSAHWWDVTGAKRAGLQTAWVSRKEQLLMPGTPTPDIQASTLLGAAQAVASTVRRPLQS